MLGNNPNALERANTNLKNILPGAKKETPLLPLLRAFTLEKL